MGGRKACYCSSLLVLSLLTVAFGLGNITVGSWLTDAVVSEYSDEDESNDVLEAEQDYPLDVTDADSGFSPEKNGFSFENYGNELGVMDLTPDEMQSMFGDQVCSGDDACTLIPSARRWMEEANEAMSGGHCEGMAVLSLLMYYGLIDPAYFGGVAANELNISDQNLQKEIAYWWATQVTSPADSYRIYGPNQTLKVLVETFKQGKSASETWTMGVFKDDGSGGHAITPFAVVDKGNGIYGILVYDNNYPNQTRVVEIDSNNDVFSYEASPNPQMPSDPYTGQNLEISGTNGRLERQVCSFCQEDDSDDVSAPEKAEKSVKGSYVQVWHDGNADMLIKDDQGHRLGWLSNGTFANEIPGAKVHGFLTEKGNKSEYLYWLPSGINYSASLDGVGLNAEEMQEVTTIGPGYYTEAKGLAFSKETRGLVGFSSTKGRYDVSYRCDSRESPSFRAGVQTRSGPSYEFHVKKNSTARGNESDTFGKLTSMGVDSDGGRLKVKSGDSGDENIYDREAGRLKVKSVDSESSDLYDLKVAKLSEKGPEVFLHNGIALDEGEAMIVDYSDWEGEGDDMSIGIDENDDGFLDETLDLEDEGGSYEDIIDDESEETDAEDDESQESDAEDGNDEEADLTREVVSDEVDPLFGDDSGLGGDFDAGGDE